MNKRFLLLGISILTVASVWAIIQRSHWAIGRVSALEEKLDGRAEFEKLYQLWGNADSGFSVRGTIRLYDAEHEPSFKEETSFQARREKASFYSQLGPLQNFCDGVWVVQVDSVHHVITAAKANRAPGLLPSSAFPFEQWMNEQSSFQLHLTAKEENGERVLTIVSDFQPQIKACHIYYDPATYRIRQTTLEWWKEGVVPDTASKQFWLTTIDYRYEPVAAINSSEAIKQIVSFGKHTVQPTAAFSSYQLICDDQP